MSYFFSCFFVYSFVGCGLETLFALVTQGELMARKTLLLFPLCPVYGLGALAIILVCRNHGDRPWLVFLLGMAAATAVEFLMDILYRDILGVQIWDYSDQFLNLDGRICLPFSLAWGLLAVALVKYVHPRIHQMIKNVPAKVNLPVALVTVFDIVLSSMLLWLFEDKSIIENVFSLYI